MTRSLLAAILMVMLSAPAVFGQAKLLPPIVRSDEESKGPELPLPVPATPVVATIGTPSALPPLPPLPPMPSLAPLADAAQPVGTSDVPQTSRPFQMQGREPAHGKLTGGIPLTTPVPTPETPALVFPEPKVCGPAGRVWAELDYLVWFVEGDKPPALLTTSPPGTPQGQAGILHAPGTSVLAGGRYFNDDGRSGARLNLGYWFDPLQTIGIQASVFWLANNDSSATFASNGDPILARPYRDVTTGQQAVELIAYPGFSSGSVNVSAHSSFDGWDVAFRQNACCLCNGRIDALVGYRQLRLADQLGISEDVTSLTAAGPRGLPTGSQLLVADRFDTLNEFYGAEVGVVGEYRYRQWVVEGLAKMAAGWNVSHVNINGASLITVPGSPTVANSGGLLALSTNSGLVRDSHPTLIPELGVNAAWDLSGHLRVRGGYSFLYWDQVHRPGQQIDQGINPNLVPPVTGGGPVRPATSREDTDLFVHGLNFGVEVRY